MRPVTVIAVLVRLTGVVGLSLLGLGVLTDTLALSIAGGVLVLAAVVAGLIDARRRMG